MDDVLVVVPGIHRDDRGYFSELFRQDVFADMGLPSQFVQLNKSGSAKGVVRGIHFQWDPPLGKLMRVTRGRVFFVAVDIRKGSPTVGDWFGVEHSAEDGKHIWAPAGFGRAFAVLSDYAEIEYLCTAIYNPAGEGAVRWNDPQIGVDWPLEAPLLSAKDENAQTLAEWLARDEARALAYDR